MSWDSIQRRREKEIQRERRWRTTTDLYGLEDLDELISREVVRRTFMLHAIIDDTLLSIEPFKRLLTAIMKQAKEMVYPDAKIAVFGYDDETKAWRINLFLGEPEHKDTAVGSEVIEEQVDGIMYEEMNVPQGFIVFEALEELHPFPGMHLPQ